MKRGKEAKYRVGVIGCGRKGQVFARAFQLNPLTEIAAMADIDPENLEFMTKRFEVPGYKDYRDMLEKEKIDIASVILNVEPNPSVVIGCAEAGVKAIQCEKPMASSLEEADRMVDACRSRNIKFAVGDLERNFPQYWEVKSMLDSGRIGEVKSINILSGMWVQISGGGIQQLSLMRLFAGDADVAWITGWVNDDPLCEYDQGAGGYIRFVNGIECFIHPEMYAKTGMEVLGTEGVFYTDENFFYLWEREADNRHKPALKRVEGFFPPASIHADVDQRDSEGWMIRKRNQHTVQSLVEALENGKEPRADGDNGRKALEIGIALRESHRQGHRPVRLPLTDRSLRMIPSPSRRLAKKGTKMTREAYLKALANEKI